MAAPVTLLGSGPEPLVVFNNRLYVLFVVDDYSVPIGDKGGLQSVSSVTTKVATASLLLSALIL